VSVVVNSSFSLLIHGIVAALRQKSCLSPRPNSFTSQTATRRNTFRALFDTLDDHGESSFFRHQVHVFRPGEIYVVHAKFTTPNTSPQDLIRDGYVATL
jgi:hypothetical protein